MTPGQYTREVWVMFISLLFLSQATLFFNPDSFHFADRKNEVIFFKLTLQVLLLDNTNVDSSSKNKPPCSRHFIVKSFTVFMRIKTLKNYMHLVACSSGTYSYWPNEGSAPLALGPVTKPIVQFRIKNYR